MSLPTEHLTSTATLAFAVAILYAGIAWLAVRSISHGEAIAAIRTQLNKITSNDLHGIETRLCKIERMVGIKRP